MNLSEAVVLSWKRVEWPLWVLDESPPLVAEFGYVRVLCSTQGSVEWRLLDQWSSAVTQTLHQTVVVSKAHPWWVVTERKGSQITTCKTNFLSGMSGLSLRDRVRSSVIWVRGHRLEPDGTARASGSQASWMHLWCNFPGMFHPKETPGKAQDTLE